MIRKYQESVRQETEDTRRTEHMRSRMDLVYRRSLQFLPLDEHLAIRSAVMTTSDRWVILDNGSRMLEVTTKECHGLHRYDRVSLEGGTSSLSSLRRTVARINSWYNFQAEEMYVSRVINQRTVQIVLTGTFDALDFSHISVTLNMHKLAPEMIIPLTMVTEIVVCLSTTENLKLFVDGLEGHQNLPLKKNRPKGLVIVDIEMVAVKSCKSPDYFGWNGWQSIVIETEYGDAQVDKADENSQFLETYDAMRKTTESEREAKDQIMEQVNKYARNGGRRYCWVFTWLSQKRVDLPSTDSKAETEMLGVKMRLTKAIRWSHAKSGDDTAEKSVSDDVKMTLAEATQLLENVSEQLSKSSLTYETLKMRKKVHQIKERREVLEKLQELNKENEKDNTELMNIAARFNRLNVATRPQQDTRSLETSQLEFQDAVEAKDAEAAKVGKPDVNIMTRAVRKLFSYPINVVIKVACLVTPIQDGPVERMLQWMVTRRWRRISGSGCWCRRP